MNPVANPESSIAARPHKSTPSFLIENHDEAYYLWRDAGVRQVPLVHVDAHHDMWPIASGGPTTVGSYVFRAIKEGIVSRIYWVVPDGAFTSEENVSLLLRNLKDLPELTALRRSANKIEAQYAGCHLLVCSAKDLPPIAEDALLDVDVDYFLLPIVCAPETNEVPERMPWCWPEELQSSLSSKFNVHTVTIAYSVNGGTTPLRWKLLGDEFQLRWLCEAEDEALKYFARIRESAERQESGDFAAAMTLLNDAIALKPEQAEAHWHLAETLDECGRSQEARSSFSRAVQIDPSYASVFNSAGPCLEAAGQVDSAAEEYHRILRLDLANAHALCGLGRIAALRGDFQSSQKHLQKALNTDGDLIEAHRILGDVCFALQDSAGALSGYENYIRLLRAGHRSLPTPISSADEVEDVHELAVRARMANLYRSAGNTEKAEQEFGWLSNRRVPNTPIASVKIQHAILLFKQGRISNAANECGSALVSLPTDVRRAVQKILKNRSAQDAGSPAKNAFLNAVRMAVSFMAAIATSAILARSLGPEAMGVYSYTLWIAGVIVALCHFGIPTALSKFVAEHLGADDSSAARSVARRLLGFQLVIVLAAMTIGSFILFAAKSTVPWLFAVLLVLPMALQQALTGTLMGAHDYAKLSWNGAWGAVAQVVLVTIAAWRGGTLLQFLLAVLVANLCTAFLYYLQLRNASWWTSSPAQARENKFDALRVARFSAPVAYLVLLDMVVWQRSELWFLRKYSVWQEIAFYSIAYLMVHRLTEALVSVTSTLVPLQARQHGREGVKGVARIHEQALCLVQVFLLPVCIGAALLSRTVILALYGPAYLRVWPVLLVLLASPVAMSLTDVSVASLYAVDRQKSLMVPLTLTAILNIALAFVLVPGWGAMGAAAANCAAQLAEGSFLLLFASSVLSLSVPWMRFFKIYCAAVVSFLPAAVVFWLGWPTLVLAFTLVIACGLYFLFLQTFSQTGFGNSLTMSPFAGEQTNAGA